MADHGRPVLHRPCDTVSGANWRPTRFADELTLVRYACCVCRVIPSTTVLLPCSHALCEQCLAGCVVQDGGSVCPVDHEPFSEDECQKNRLPAKKKRNLQAHCWNEGDGCEFVGTIEAVLLHFDRECAFHAIQCPRCEQRILRKDIAAHYVARCCLPNSPYANDASPGMLGSSLESRDMSTLQDQLSTLQGQMNEVLELCRGTDIARTQGISRAVSGSEDSFLREIKSIEASICSMVTRKLNAGLEELKVHIGDPCSDHIATIQSQVNELVEQCRAHDASRLEQMESVLRESVSHLMSHGNRVEANLFSRLEDAQQSLQRSAASLQQNIHSSERESASAVATLREPDGTSVRQEMRLILRKLDAFARASLSTLEFLRQQAYRNDDKPWLSRVAPQLHCCWMTRDDKMRTFLCLTSAEKIFQLKPKDCIEYEDWTHNDAYVKLGLFNEERLEPVLL
ncbi:hypothetical protein HPB50_005418 [Hyalomma asiaticum]|uniref:Uncharacterized protein n=1 Tax=Hyalomma asiaticum TaxID=266040 RepID=A0ACB7RH08_HYAAI|nr:hypothetical protein HPB50_005418 [Hyalomma asiaticum]